MTEGSSMHNPKSTRGSVLIVAAIMAIIIAIALTSYVQLAGNSMKLANRSFYFNGAMNLVDTGIEQALWSINNGNWGTGAPNYWSSSVTDQYKCTISAPNIGPGVQGQVKVWADLSGTGPGSSVNGAGTGIPHFVAQAKVTLADNTTFIKEAEVYATNSSLFANGLVAKDTITFTGNNAIADSWDSDPNNNGSPIVAYSSTRPPAHDKTKVASASVLVDAITVSNADIYGYVAVGGNSSGDISLGPNGTIGSYDTARNGYIDTSRVTNDFTSSFPDGALPQGAPTQNSNNTITAIGSGITTLPITGKGTTASDGTVYYYVSSVSLSGTNDALQISPNSKVAIVVTNTNGTPISVTGSDAQIDIPTGSSLTMYTSGNVAIAGGGVVNGTYTTNNQGNVNSGTPNQPKNFSLVGTLATSSPQTYQDIKIAGNGVLSGIVYAPNSNLEMKGGGNGGNVFGAGVADTVKIAGGANFHYDESLARLNTNNVWKLTQWLELTTADARSAYAAQLNF